MTLREGTLRLKICSLHWSVIEVLKIQLRGMFICFESTLFDEPKTLEKSVVTWAMGISLTQVHLSENESHTLMHPVALVVGRVQPDAIPKRTTSGARRPASGGRPQGGCWRPTQALQGPKRLLQLHWRPEMLRTQPNCDWHAWHGRMGFPGNLPRDNFLRHRIISPHTSPRWSIVDMNDHSSRTTAQRCDSETETNILEDLFSSVLSQFKKYHASRNLKFNNLGIFQSLKFRILIEKYFQFLLS